MNVNEMMVSFKEFKKWCKANNKNSAFTKNMIEFMELEEVKKVAAKCFEEPEEKVTLARSVYDDMETKEFDGLIVIGSTINKNKPNITELLIDGTFTNKVMLENCMLLIKIALSGEGPNDEKMGYDNEELKLIETAFKVLVELLEEE